MGQKLIFMIINMIDQFTLSLISGIFIGGGSGIFGFFNDYKKNGFGW